VLLLEAYEQLERDVGKEVDRALGGQAEELRRLGRRAAFLEEQLAGERGQVAALQQQGAELQEQLGEAQGRCSAYEAGVYGLPQVRAGGAQLHPSWSWERAVGALPPCSWK
jgi:centrosomal protein CEP290